MAALSIVHRCRFEELLNMNTARLLLHGFALRWVAIRLSLLNSALFAFLALIIFLLRDVVPTSFVGATFVYGIQVCETDTICISLRWLGDS